MRILFRISLFAIALVGASAAFSQNNRSAVSLSGTDTATCTVPDPCRTFGVAMSKTNAGGEIVVLATAGYGPFNVTKSVSVISPPAYHAAMAPSTGTAITIDTPGVTVILRNLYLNSLGAATGISITAGGSTVHVENLVINGFTGNGIEANGDFATNTAVFNKDTEIRGCGGSGIFASPTAGKLTLSVDGTRMEKNGHGLVADKGVDVVVRNSTAIKHPIVGFWLRNGGGLSNANGTIERSVAGQNGFSGFETNGGAKLTISNSVSAQNSDGFRSQNGASLAADHCTASDNTNGFVADSNANITVSSSLATRNVDGMAVITSGTAHLSGNTVTNNTVGLHVTGIGVMESVGNNMVRGNGTNISGTVMTVSPN